MGNVEGKRKKIYAIIEKIYENEDLSEKDLDLKVDKAIEKGTIGVFYSETEQGYSFETKYNLRKEQLEFLIDSKVQEIHELPINEMVKISDMDAEEFHQEFSSLSLESEIKIEIDPWAKKILEFKSKDKNLENEIIEEN